MRNGMSAIASRFGGVVVGMRSLDAFAGDVEAAADSLAVWGKGGVKIELRRSRFAASSDAPGLLAASVSPEFLDISSEALGLASAAPEKGTYFCSSRADSCSLEELST